MALTSVTIFDVLGETQQIQFYQGSTLVDQINYVSNNITFNAQTSFDLNNSDFALYWQYLNVFNLLIGTNFPLTSSSQLNSIPNSSFSLTRSDEDRGMIKYFQSSLRDESIVYDISYAVSNSTASFAKRGNPIAITRQEFYLCINFMFQLANQVALK